MYKLIALCCCLLVGITACLAQARKKAAINDGKSLLWKISGKGLKKPSYLFGTLHVICPDEYVWTSAMQKALKASDKVAFEMDMDDPALQGQVASGMMMKDGKKLKDYYSEEEYNRLSAVAVKNGIPLAMMQNLNPFAIISFLYMKATTCQVPDSYEGNIMKIAQEDDKEIVGLESLQEQLKVINGMNADTVARQVLKIADDLDSFKITYREMLTLYKKQDLPELHKMFLESPDYKDDLDLLLYDRNRSWVPIIGDLAKEQSTFFAVGAGHLWGDDGVIDLLRKEGYTVEALR